MADCFSRPFVSGGVPLSLYIHFPWCVRKCPYCDFNSHEISPPRRRGDAASSPQGAKKRLGRPGAFLDRGGVPEGEYVDALLRDIDAALPLAEGRTVQTVFIGGGTPSLISPAALDRLLSAVSRRLAFAPEAEITLEANPGAIEAAKFAAFRAAGITRLSLGIQSFDDAKLAALGRIHSADEARRAAELAAAHFGHVNLDLMVALPGQTLAEARRDVETAIGLGPGHLSAYALTIEPNTAFHHAPPAVPDDDLAADMQEMAEGLLAAAGYAHYETSAFAKPGERCRHNLNYWTFGDYLGLGAGAHSKIGRRREARPRNPKDYLANPISRDWQPIAPEDLPGEFMMNALRLADGFAPALFEARTGLPLSAIEAPVAAARREGLLEASEEPIRPTPLGRRFLNRLIGRFLAA